MEGLYLAYLSRFSETALMQIFALFGLLLLLFSALDGWHVTTDLILAVGEVAPFPVTSGQCALIDQIIRSP